MQRLREWERHREKQRKRQTDPKREERIMEWYIDWQTDGGENDRNIDENETLPQKVLLHCVLCLSTIVICASQKNSLLKVPELQWSPCKRKRCLSGSYLRIFNRLLWHSVQFCPYKFVLVQLEHWVYLTLLYV